jgi:hypothetical protein
LAIATKLLNKNWKKNWTTEIQRHWDFLLFLSLCVLCGLSGKNIYGTETQIN